MFFITCADDTHYKFDADFISVLYSAYKRFHISPLGIQSHCIVSKTAWDLGMVTEFSTLTVFEQSIVYSISGYAGCKL